MDSPATGNRPVGDFLPLPARDFHVLFALIDGPRHGYGLVKLIAEQSSGSVKLDPAGLYRSVGRMMEDGLVEESDEIPEPSSHPRRYYHLTQLGLRVVAAEADRMRALATATRGRLRKSTRRV